MICSLLVTNFFVFWTQLKCYNLKETFSFLSFKGSILPTYNYFLHSNLFKFLVVFTLKLEYTHTHTHTHTHAHLILTGFLTLGGHILSTMPQQVSMKIPNTAITGNSLKFMQIQTKLYSYFWIFGKHYKQNLANSIQFTKFLTKKMKISYL
jgi:hypothetical protein